MENLTTLYVILMITGGLTAIIFIYAKKFTSQFIKTFVGISGFASILFGLTTETITFSIIAAISGVILILAGLFYSSK